jgi:periplasmic protein TonB
MQEAVSGVLIGRRREVDGLSRMITFSLVAHVVCVGLILLVPSDWLTSRPEPAERPMMISLGGVPGPDTKGMTAISNRPVQAEAPPDIKPVDTPPAARTPEMVAPAPEVKPKPVKPVEKPVEKSSTRKPSTGAAVRSGAARVETGGVDVPFGGLAMGGGGTGGVRIEGNFCCPEYIETMKQSIYKNWDQSLGAIGKVEIKFTVRRDGMLTNVSVEKTSNNPLLDLESRRAVLVTQRIPPLPDRYTGPTLTIYLTFEYKR